jgi:hypothetical protein
MATWREMIKEVMDDYGESWNSVEAIKPKTLDLDLEFDASYGTIEGVPFYLWTKKRVYFAVTTDGMEWVASVSRNPTGAQPKHVGNEI